MTLAAVWKVGEVIFSIADTRIIRSQGNVLTEHGPKLLPLTVVSTQESRYPGEDHVVHAMTFGFAYAGATLSALSTHALAQTLYQSLLGPSGSPPPDFHEISIGVGEIARRYMREIGELNGANALFRAILFGICPRTDRFRAFELSPSLESNGVSVDVLEHDLYQPENLIVIGSNPDLLRARVAKERPSLYADQSGNISPRMAPLREIDLPRRALAAIIAEQADPAIGGTTQEARVSRLGFRPFTRMVPGAPARYEVLGFDMFGFTSVGSYSFSLPGRV